MDPSFDPTTDLSELANLSLQDTPESIAQFEDMDDIIMPDASPLMNNHGNSSQVSAQAQYTEATALLNNCDITRPELHMQNLPAMNFSRSDPNVVAGFKDLPVIGKAFPHSPEASSRSYNMRTEVADVHGKFGLYQCSFCGYSAAKNSNLKRYVSTNALQESAPPFVCNTCSIRRSTRRPFRTHLTSELRPDDL